MNKLILALLAIGFVATACAESNRMYIDDKELDATNDAFYLHIGHNEWLKTETVHRDKTGLYTYEDNITRIADKKGSSYQKTWKCPYCYMQVPVGEACSNSQCPSKYPAKKKLS